jgi:hypothetical protein
MVIPAMPITTAVAPMCVVSMTSVITSVSSVSSCMNGAVTGVNGSRRGGKHSQNCDQGKAQFFHSIRYSFRFLAVHGSTAFSYFYVSSCIENPSLTASIDDIYIFPMFHAITRMDYPDATRRSKILLRKYRVGLDLGFW